jgi:hypothetical protein
VNGQHPCRICAFILEDKYSLKKHIFTEHPDIDMRAKYATTVEKFVGPYYMSRFRETVFAKIDKDKMLKAIEDQLSEKAPFKLSDISFTFPVNVDLDRLNAERRKTLYAKKRDILMKLSKEVLDKLPQFEPFSRQEDLTEQKQFIIFDLSLNMYNEGIPDQIFKCLRYSRMKKGASQQYLPRFIDLTRCGMQVQLQLSKNIIMLREIIGNRSKMVEMASSIVSQLLMGMLAIQKEDFILHTI